MQSSPNKEITVYTDGSCHTQKRAGAWVAILFIEHQKIVIWGKATDTTHNRMELIAVIAAIEYLLQNNIEFDSLKVITDSQYVVELPNREQKLVAKNFITKKGKDLNNTDLVKKLLALYATHNIVFEKIKAHQKQTTTLNYNIEADILVRKLVREMI